MRPETDGSGDSQDELDREIARSGRFAARIIGRRPCAPIGWLLPTATSRPTARRGNGRRAFTRGLPDRRRVHRSRGGTMRGCDSQRWWLVGMVGAVAACVSPIGDLDGTRDGSVSEDTAPGAIALPAFVRERHLLEAELPNN